jgi:hypothetical protein
MQLPIVFTIISLLLTASVAVASWYIAHWQASISEEKLRFDLYEKRFSVYSRAVDYLQSLVSWKGSDEDHAAHRLFIKAKLESVFLFPNSEIPTLLEKMHLDASKVMGLKEHGKELAADPPSFTEFYNQGMAGLSNFGLGVTELQREMAPYLNFELMRRSTTKIQKSLSTQ